MSVLSKGFCRLGSRKKARGLVKHTAVHTVPGYVRHTSRKLRHKNCRKKQQSKKCGNHFSLRSNDFSSSRSSVGSHDERELACRCVGALGVYTDEPRCNPARGGIAVLLSRKETPLVQTNTPAPLPQNGSGKQQCTQGLYTCKMFSSPDFSANSVIVNFFGRNTPSTPRTMSS